MVLNFKVRRLLVVRLVTFFMYIPFVLQNIKNNYRKKIIYVTFVTRKKNLKSSVIPLLSDSLADDNEL